MPDVFYFQIPDNGDTTNVDGYIVAFRRTFPSNSDYHQCVIQDKSAISHYKEGLQPDMTYQVKVAAFNSFGCGQFTIPKLFVFFGLYNITSIHSLRYQNFVFIWFV